jgi:hypothetical protein
MTEEQWLPMVVGAIAALIPSILNTFVSDDSWYGKIIAALAVAFGKGSNDPKVQ